MKPEIVAAVGVGLLAYGAYKYFSTPGVWNPNAELATTGDVVAVNGKSVGSAAEAEEVLLVDAPLGRDTCIGILGKNGQEVTFSRSAILAIVKRRDAPSPTEPGGSLGPPVIPSDGGPTKLGTPLTLHNGRTYAGTVKLSGLEASLASPSAIEQQFASIGFQNVHATASPPPGFPDSAFAPGGGVYFVTGVWGQNDATVPRPPQLVEAWET